VIAAVLLEGTPIETCLAPARMMSMSETVDTLKDRVSGVGLGGR
jgi:hypothetical protein